MKVELEIEAGQLGEAFVEMFNINQQNNLNQTSLNIIKQNLGIQ